MSDLGLDAPDVGAAPGARPVRSYAQLAYAALLVFVGYYAGSRLGLALTFLPNPISVLWPPNAILLAALLLAPVRAWWVLILAALPAHLLGELPAGVPASMVLSWFVSNVSEALIGAVCVRYLVRGPLTFDSLRSVAVFVAFAAVLAPFLSSFLDAGFVTLNGWGQTGYWGLWQTRFFSNVLATLTLVPLIVTWASGGIASLLADRRRLIEGGVLLSGLLATSIFVFDSPASSSAPAALLYLPLPFLLWAALRFGPAGASTAFAIVAFLVIWGAGHGMGPLVASAPADNTLSVQLFLIFVAPSLLCLAAAVQERRNAEQRLRGSEQRFAKTFRSSPDAMSLTRKTDARILDVNDRWQTLFGCHLREAVGRTVPEAGFFVEADAWGRIKRLVDDRGSVRDVEIEIRNRPGEILQAVIAVEAVDMDGEPCFITMLRDVTERKRVEEALRASEERYREVVESRSELVCRYLPDTTLTFVNEAYCRSFGRLRQDLIGRKFLELIPESTREAAASHVASLVRDPGERTIEHEVLRRDGTVGWQQWIDSVIVAADGQVRELQGIGRDITERKRAEEANQKLAHASRLAVMGQLTALIAHEVNQPLGAILSNADAAEMLLEAGAGRLDEVRRILADIRKDDLRASEVVRRIRELVRTHELERQPLDLNEVTSGVVQLLGADATRRGVAVETELAAALPAVRGDRVHLQQVLLNLLLNGMDAMAEMPEPQRRLAVRTASGDGGVEVSVTDAGPGIPPERLPRLFDSFFTTKKDGMGMGLTIARSIVEAHGGRIWVDGNPAGGATFRFTVPTEPAA